MGKLFRLRDYILISAAMAGELFEDVRLVGGLMPKVLRERYGFVPSRYKRASYLTTVSQMLSTGEIRKTVSGKGKVQLELTSVGQKQFKRHFPIFLQRKKWDGWFMVVIFDIPEKYSLIRVRLRSKLEELGFGMLQKSVWISPYHFEDDLREYLVNNGLEKQAYVLSAKKLWLGNVKQMAETVWKLNKINSGYKRVLRETRRYFKISNRNLQKQILDSTYQLYIDTLTTDPLLPRELLPDYWLQAKALRALNNTWTKHFR